MNREVLVAFSVDELQRFQVVSKKRVQDMRELMVELQGENKRLGIEYEKLVKRKKEVHDQLKLKESGLMKIYSESKKKMGDIMGIFKKQGKTYHPKANEQPITQEDKKKKEKEEQLPQKKIITSNNFEFDDLYNLSKEKVQKIVKEGSHKLHQISEAVKQKYNSLSKHSQPPKEPEKQISHFLPQPKPVEESEQPSIDKAHS